MGLLCEYSFAFVPHGDTTLKPRSHKATKSAGAYRLRSPRQARMPILSAGLTPAALMGCQAFGSNGDVDLADFHRLASDFVRP
jgi:hypothetical protein